MPSSTIRPPSQPTRRALRKQERLRVTAPGTRPSPLPRRQWPGIPAGWLVIAQPLEQDFLLRSPIARAELASSRKSRSPARTTRGLPPSAARNASSIASDFGVEPLSRDDPILVDCQVHHVGVSRTPSDGVDSAHIVTSIDQQLDDRSGNVLVDERCHRGTG